jgi:branched-chain amino acid transport system ATP-binding protein
MTQSPPDAPILELHDVYAGYGAGTVLHGISLSLGRGTVVAVIGANGAGKTTTLKVISGVLGLARGEVRVDGSPVRSSASAMVKLGVAHCPEGRRLFPSMTVRENLETGAHTVRGSSRIAERLEYVYALFSVLKERANQRAGTLSGGEQQMAAVGRALMSYPRILLLDEPTLGLSPVMVRTVARMITRIAQDGISIMLVEQNANVALDLADRGYVLESGRVLLEGDASELRRDERVRTVYLSAG